MTIITVQATYQDGRFVLKTPLGLVNGTMVEIIKIQVISQAKTDSDDTQVETTPKQNQDRSLSEGEE